MAKEKKSQPEKQIHKKPGEKIIAAILKNIKSGKDNPKLTWPGCPRFFPPK